MRNRIIMPPMANNVADEDGTASAKLVEHYRVRAAGGPGMIIVEHSYVTRDGRVDPHQLGICDDAHVAGLAPIAAAIHDGGALAVIQITHGGARCPSAATGRQPVGPSNVRVPGDAEDPRPLTSRRSTASRPSSPPPPAARWRPDSTASRCTEHTGTC